MPLSKEDILELFNSKITEEEKFIILTLFEAQPEPLNKEALWDKTNKLYKEYIKQKGMNEDTKLLPTRYALDQHTLKLEGANLVEVTNYGRTRIYKLSTFGKELFEYRTKLINEGE